MSLFIVPCTVCNAPIAWLQNPDDRFDYTWVSEGDVDEPTLEYSRPGDSRVLSRALYASQPEHIHAPI